MIVIRSTRDFEKDTDIYQMSLFAVVNLPNDAWLTRVPGGWIYGSTYWEGDEQKATSNGAVFIPYSEEFNKDPEEILNLAKDEKPEVHADPDPEPEETGGSQTRSSRNTPPG